MACTPCQKAREATGNALRAAASGKLTQAAAHLRTAASAAADKAESLRVRMLTRKA